MTLTDSEKSSNEVDLRPALSFVDLSMVYPDGTHALESISIDVHPGEFITVVGPSGCGKSTLLKIASGLTNQSSGECRVNRDSIGYVFQDATLLPWRTVRRNVELLGELHKMPKDELAARSAEAIALVGLDGNERKYPKQLSGGMRMRASLARSLVMKPDVFLFDEPFGALDEISRERLNDELLKLFKLEGFAGLFITHSVAEAVFLSTRVLVMSGRPGRIIDDIAIPFDFPRAPELRYDPLFAEISARVSAGLKAAHQ